MRTLFERNLFEQESDILYHVTKTENVPKIMERGISKLEGYR